MNSTCGKYVGTSRGNNSIDANFPTLRERRFIQVIVAVVYCERGGFQDGNRDRPTAQARKRLAQTERPLQVASACGASRFKNGTDEAAEGPATVSTGSSYFIVAGNEGPRRGSRAEVPSRRPRARRNVTERLPKFRPVMLDRMLTPLCVLSLISKKRDGTRTGDR